MNRSAPVNPAHAWRGGPLALWASAAKYSPTGHLGPRQQLVDCSVVEPDTGPSSRARASW